jgi:hypothetical protein
VIPPAAQRAMAQHAQAHIVKVDASYLSMTSHPAGTASLRGQRVAMVAETGKEP